jgi:hypothetical protein
MSRSATEQVIGILQTDPSIAMDFMADLSGDFEGYGLRLDHTDDLTDLSPRRLGEALLFALSDFPNAWPEFSGIELHLVDWTAVGDFVVSTVNVPATWSA